MRLSRPLLSLHLALAATGCGASAPDATSEALPQPSRPPAAVSADDVRSLSVPSDVSTESGQETYACVVLDGSDLAGRYLRSVAWTPPDGPVALHHATLYAADDDASPGPVPCDSLPATVSVLHVYTPGSAALSLPDGVAVHIPASTRRLEVQLHLLRVDAGTAPPTKIDLHLLAKPPERVAGWVDVRAPVPTMPPHTRATETGLCRLAQGGHVVSTWPHMHLAGASFTGTIVRVDGARESLIDVPMWDFYHQPMYPRDVELSPGDAVETSCTWANEGERDVEPGPYSFEEMCNQGIYVWPVEAATCAP